MTAPSPNSRVLVVDDTPSIHEDFRKILGSASGTTDTHRKDLAEARARFFGGGDAVAGSSAVQTFELDSALQGQEALAMVRAAVDEGRPYAVAFVDIRMPPGWDGVETIRELWKVDEKLQCVICTAFSDYSWEQTVEALGRSDRLLILKKPFDPVEIRQFATALSEKWNSSEREARARAAIEAKEAEMRAYAKSLETANQALRSSKASADRAAELKQCFLERLTADVGDNLGGIVEELLASGRTDGLEATLDRSRRVLETVARALDLSRLEQGTLDVTPVPCDIGAMLRAIEERQRPAAEARGLELSFCASPDVPERMETDPGRLEEVLEQLVCNAVQFTHEGRVDLRVSTEPTSSWETARVRFEVRDSGAGLTREESGLLFEPFRAIDRGDRRAGSGLGLAVARQVAKLLGGELTYEPGPEGGAVFALTLETRRL